MGQAGIFEDGEDAVHVLSNGPVQFHKGFKPAALRPGEPFGQLRRALLGAQVAAEDPPQQFLQPLRSS